MITFGTSGWRGVIADDFTFEKVRIVTQAIADYSRASAPDRPVLVGYDTRFLSEHFALTAAEVLAGNGITALLCRRDTPTPVIAFEILRQKLAGGINFTASHNPSNYNGLKFSPSWGGPALPETTKAIEAACLRLSAREVKSLPASEARPRKLIIDADPRPAYLRRVRSLVNIKALRRARLKIAADVIYGTGRGYLDELLAGSGARLSIINDHRDVLFGGHPPEPSRENLSELAGILKKESCRLGLSTDGDADRFGIIDTDGSFIHPNQVIAVLLYHLVKTRAWKGIAARSVMTTHLIDRIAGHLGVEVRETPVGFKYIGEILVKEPQRFIIGGEESGGLTIRGHVPEKDGILACMLVAEMVAMHGMSVKGILREIQKITGPVLSDRANFHLSRDQMTALRARLAAPPETFAGKAVEKIVTLDGHKFTLAGGSWLGVRLSGTEPVVRLYLEADSPTLLKRLAAAGRSFILGLR